MWNGELQFDLGRSTDVISGAPKAEAAMMLLRGMNCGTIAMDEISLAADAAAVEQLTGCGVRVLATGPRRLALGSCAARAAAGAPSRSARLRAP